MERLPAVLIDILCCFAGSNTLGQTSVSLNKNMSVFKRRMARMRLGLLDARALHPVRVNMQRWLKTYEFTRLARIQKFFRAPVYHCDKENFFVLYALIEAKNNGYTYKYNIMPSRELRFVLPDTSHTIRELVLINGLGTHQFMIACFLRGLEFSPNKHYPLHELLFVFDNQGRVYETRAMDLLDCDVRDFIDGLTHSACSTLLLHAMSTSKCSICNKPIKAPIVCRRRNRNPGLGPKCYGKYMTFRRSILVSYRAYFRHLQFNDAMINDITD